jgi:predicted Rossmann fold nucleotide-binding protein DprA/Smf involved in DNA uptake
VTDVPDGGYVAALAGFRGMTPRRLRLLLDHLAPCDAFEVAAGAAAPTPIVARLLTDELRGWWRQSAGERSPASCWDHCQAAGVEVVTARDPRFPAVLGLDPSPPAVLFVRGDLGVLDARRVGIVGTRNATLAGRQTAGALGFDLAAAGVVVV